MARSNEIVVIGELNVDLIASGVSAGPVLGTEVLADDFTVTLGSASAIFSCGIARLGHSVTFVSRIGNDDFGHLCLESLAQRGIATDRIEIDVQSKTGVTVVVSTAEDRAMITFLGAIAELRSRRFRRISFTVIGTFTLRRITFRRHCSRTFRIFSMRQGKRGRRLRSTRIQIRRKAATRKS